MALKRIEIKEKNEYFKNLLFILGASRFNIGNNDSDLFNKEGVNKGYVETKLIYPTVKIKDTDKVLKFTFGYNKFFVKKEERGVDYSIIVDNETVELTDMLLLEVVNMALSNKNITNTTAIAILTEVKTILLS